MQVHYFVHPVSQYRPDYLERQCYRHFDDPVQEDLQAAEALVFWCH